MAPRRASGSGGLFGSLKLFGQADQQQQVQEMKGTAEESDTGAHGNAAPTPLGSIAPLFPTGPQPPSPFSAKPPPPPLAGGATFAPTGGALATLRGVPKYLTLRVRGTVRGQRVSVLVDSGATHNFIDAQMVERRGIQTESFDGF